jgi:hypothetical protein
MGQDRDCFFEARTGWILCLTCWIFHPLGDLHEKCDETRMREMAPSYQEMIRGMKGEMRK